MPGLTESEKVAFRYFSIYQEEVKRTKKNHESIRDELCDYSMGVSGEAGEVLDLIKKVCWQGKPMNIEKVIEEMGDVLWYLAALSDTIGVSLDTVVEYNIIKLRERYQTGYSHEESEGRKEYRNE
jgi:NTP pyrophosphatase (non-canonical NTP hydrolase)